MFSRNLAYSPDHPAELLYPLTRSCFLLLLGRLSMLILPLLGIFLPSLWSPFFPPHAPAPISPKCGSLILTLPTLRSGDLDRWLCSFSFWQKRLRVLANCLLCGTEASLSFSEDPVCLSFSTKAGAILHALRWSRQHQQVCLFSSLRLSLCPLLRLSFYLKLSGRPGSNCLFLPLLSSYNRSPDTRFSLGTTRLMSWPDGKCYSCSLQSLEFPLLLSLVSTLFSKWRRTV